MCSAVGCVKRLPPAPIPAPVAPAVDAAPSPPGGHGRLLVDVVEAPVPVQRITMASKQVDAGNGRSVYRFFEVPETLCAAAPCATDVPTGNVLLGFPVLGKPGVTEVELVNVGPDPSVYRRSLSIYDDNTGGVRTYGVFATIFGGASLITGATLLPIGLGTDTNGLTISGGITLGVGAVLLATGIWALNHDAPTYRPGSSNHFPLTPASR
jgi:hypothetical protein